MTLLNGEPVDTGVASTASRSPAGSPSGVSTRPPLRNPVGMLLGVVGIIFAFTFPPMGIVLGAIARGMARRAGDRHPFATAAIVIGIVLSVLGLIAIAIFTWFTIAVTTAGFDYCVNGDGDGTFFGTPITCE